VTSRIEQLANTGGILISGQVYNSIINRTEIGAVFLGEKRLKNVAQPVKVYALTGDGLPEPEINSFQVKNKKLKTVQKFLKPESLIPISLVILIASVFLVSRLAKTTPISIALLPLKSITTDADQEWFTDGMTDALITDLAKISGLSIRGISSALQYKGTNKTLPQIAAELGVKYLMEGSVVKIGNKVKISARLLNALKDEYIWAGEYERGFSDILGLQGEIAQTIARQIQVKLTPHEETRLAVSRSVNPETYELYLKGMYHMNKYTREGIEKGLGYLREAVERDPADPMAYAGLALGYELIAHKPSPPPETESLARAATLKALELDENLAEVHLASAMLKIYHDWDKAGAERAYRRTLELKPSLALAHGHYAFFILLSGDEDKALAESKLAQELDPFVPVYSAWTGWMYFWLGRHDEAIEEALKSLELVPDFPVGLYVLGSAYAAKGMYEEAIVAHQKAGEISPDWEWGLGQTYALAGRTDEALGVVAELESKPKIWDTWGLAEIYTALGEKDKAFLWLETAFEQRHPYIQWLRGNSSFKSLSDDPRFDDLAQRLNLLE
jgi:TolB-like protein/Tfp pilus assembly protein PilF